MDMDSAKKAGVLIRRREYIAGLVDDMEIAVNESEHGVVTVTFPRSWLDTLIALAKGELTEIDKEINGL